MYILGLSQKTYFIDPSVTDQGALTTEGNRSIADYVDLIGTSKLAKLKMPHTSPANKTEYSLDTDIDLSSYPNIYIDPEPGAELIQVTGDEIITLYSPENLIITKRQKITAVNCIAFTNPGLFVHPEWWGAKGNGSTDCTKAIKIARDVVHAALGGIVLFSGGVYNYSSDLEMKKGVIFEGDGIYGTELKWDDTSDPTIAGLYASAPNGTPIHISLRNISLNMNRYANGAIFSALNEFTEITNFLVYSFTGVGLEVGDRDGADNQSTHFSARNIQIVPDSTQGADYGLKLNNASKTTWINVTVDVPSGASYGADIGVSVEGKQNTFIGCHFEDCGMPVKLESGQGNVFINCDAANHLAKVSRTFDGVTGTFFANVESGVTSYSFISVRDDNSNGPADYLIRDAEKSVTIPVTPSNGGLYNQVVSSVDGAIQIDGIIVGGFKTINGLGNGGANDDLDVTNIGTVFVGMSQGDVVIGGLKGGIKGQELCFVKEGISNDLTLEHNKGVGSESIICPNNADLTLSSFGGAKLVYNGSAWYVVSE